MRCCNVDTLTKQRSHSQAAHTTIDWRMVLRYLATALALIIQLITLAASSNSDDDDDDEEEEEEEAQIVCWRPNVFAQTERESHYFLVVVIRLLDGDFPVLFDVVFKQD